MIETAIKQAGYLVLYWDKAEDIPEHTKQKVIHEPTVSRKEYRLSRGSVKQVVNGISECNLTIGMGHGLYNKINPIRGIVKVINLFDDEVEFYGRVLSTNMTMTSSGFAQEIICEDFLAYLHDSTQDFEKVPNRGLADYLIRIINRHNAQVEPHKRFKLGLVNVPAPSDTPFRYTGYDSSWETIKERLIGKTDGYLVLRHEEDGMYLDYLQEIGQKIEGSPIMLGANIKSATRDLTFDGLLTRIVPVGADLDEGTMEEGSSAEIIRPQVTIKSVNNGVMYLESPELVKQFGLITKSVTWSEIHNARILKARGQQYLDSIKAILASWKIDVIERSLIDDRYVKFRVGNTHQIVNAPMAGVEELQIIEKVIDIVQPQSVSLTIGADNQTLSSFQLQQKEASKSMEKALADNAVKQKQAEVLASKVNQLALLQSELSQYQAQSDSFAQEVEAIENEMASLDEVSDKDRLSSLAIQKAIALSKKEAFDAKIKETQEKISTLQQEVVTNG